MVEIDDDKDNSHEILKIPTSKPIKMLNLVDHTNFLWTIQKKKVEVKNFKHDGLLQTGILKYFSSS